MFSPTLTISIVKIRELTRLFQAGDENPFTFPGRGSPTGITAFPMWRLPMDSAAISIACTSVMPTRQECTQRAGQLRRREQMEHGADERDFEQVLVDGRLRALTRLDQR